LLVRRVRSFLPAALALFQVLAGSASAATADPVDALPAAAALAPLVRRASVERHTVDTLWERIDGEAELYKAYGFAASAHALYEDPAQPDRRIDLSVFAVADPLGAFGLFAAFRPPECDAVQPLGNGGCISDYQGFFWHGDLFVLADAATRCVAARRSAPGARNRCRPPGAPPPRPAPLRAFSRFRHADDPLSAGAPARTGSPAARAEGTTGGTPIFVSTISGTSERGAALDDYAGVLEGTVCKERNGVLVLRGATAWAQ
jgi:hypothetical protein